MMLWLLVAVLAVWCGLGAYTFWGVRGVTTLRPNQPDLALASFPKVSILVAARNEEDVLPRALASLLALDYPNYEIVLVDDDSRDLTGAIASEWADNPSANGRLRIIHNKTLPAGWSGKVHALHLAAGSAMGEWVLATDADLVFHPAILRVAMSFALSRGLQLLSIVPEFEFGSFWEKAVLPAFTFLISLFYPPRLVNDPKSSRALASGAFILMKREDLEALGGYAKLSEVVIEDIRMAQLFKRNGRRIFLAGSRGLFHTRMYNSGREMFEGLSRTAFEATGFSLRGVLWGLIFGNLAAVLPCFAFVTRLIQDFWLGGPGWHDPFLLVSLLTCAVASLVYLPFILYVNVPAAYVFALPLASLFYTCASINSAWAHIFGRGVVWKGRHFQAPGR